MNAAVGVVWFTRLASVQALSCQLRIRTYERGPGSRLVHVYVYVLRLSISYIYEY